VDFVADSNGEIKIWIRLPVWGEEREEIVSFLEGLLNLEDVGFI
jgi:hypothetical protein